MNSELIYPHPIPSTPPRTNQSHCQLHVCSTVVIAAPAAVDVVIVIIINYFSLRSASHIVKVKV